MTCPLFKKCLRAALGSYWCDHDGNSEVVKLNGQDQPKCFSEKTAFLVYCS